jgi:hypothetical protein
MDIQDGLPGWRDKLITCWHVFKALDVNGKRRIHLDGIAQQGWDWFVLSVEELILVCDDRLLLEQIVIGMLDVRIAALPATLRRHIRRVCGNTKEL